MKNLLMHESLSAEIAYPDLHDLQVTEVPLASHSRQFVGHFTQDLSELFRAYSSLHVSQTMVPDWSLQDSQFEGQAPQTSSLSRNPSVHTVQSKISRVSSYSHSSQCAGLPFTAEQVGGMYGNRRSTGDPLHIWGYGGRLQ